MSPPTIYALASGFGRAGIAVIRISGTKAGNILCQLTGKQLPSPRYVARAKFKDPGNNEIIDEGLAIWFPGPESFTGEDVAELHVHGGRAVIERLLEVLGACARLRLARPGEFSRRAFENNKFDLTAAEGLADLINAETQAQRCQALRQMQGKLGCLYESWRQRLMGVVANVEAFIDFADEDLPEDLNVQAQRTSEELLAEINAHLSDNRCGERLRDGLHLAIIGPPNAGKSSLLNLLSQRNAAIVADMPGTTRDIIETCLDIAGYPVVLADTAGLHQGGDQIEREGVRRAEARAKEADLKLLVFDAGKDLDTHSVEFIDENTLIIINKIDINHSKNSGQFPQEINGHKPFCVSILRGDGIDVMLKALEQEVASRCQLLASPSLTQARHRQALEECRDALGRYHQADASELAAEDLRLAVRALGQITGRVDVEDILDIIFKDFCIGK